MAGRNLAAIRFFGFLLTLLAFLFLIIATPTHHWYHAEKIHNDTNITHYYYGGIFENCIATGASSGYSCTSQENSGYIKATKAFLLLAIIEFILVIIYTLILAFTRGISYKVLGVLTVVAGLLTMVAMSIYTDRHLVIGDLPGYGYSYGMGWTSFVFALIGGVLLFFGGPEVYEVL